MSERNLMDLPPGITSDDPRWQDGYYDGGEENAPSSDDPVYVAGWCTGYCGAHQSTKEEAEAAYRKAASCNSMNMIDRLNEAARAAIVAQEARGGSLASGHVTPIVVAVLKALKDIDDDTINSEGVWANAQAEDARGTIAAAVDHILSQAD